MDAKERRDLLRKMLASAGAPVTGTALARDLGVSRQVVVGDIAILRAAGDDIYATPQGYALPSQRVQGAISAKFACRHDWGRIEEELAIIVDNGGKVVDVVVEHPIYGEIKANLMLTSRREVGEFIQRLTNSGAEPLYTITGGVHLHTVEAASAEVLDQIKKDLEKAGILYS